MIEVLVLGCFALIVAVVMLVATVRSLDKELQELHWQLTVEKLNHAETKRVLERFRGAD